MSIKTGFTAVGAAFTLWWQDWTNQVLVCLAAILLSLTVVLYPAALFGVFTQARDLTHGVRTGIAGFWLGFQCFGNIVLARLAITNKECSQQAQKHAQYRQNHRLINLIGRYCHTIIDNTIK